MTEHRQQLVEEINRRAYELYRERGGEHGSDVDDWVRAEKELSDKPVVQPPKAKAAQASR